jgi:hypothetical protein
LRTAQFSTAALLLAVHKITALYIYDIYKPYAAAAVPLMHTTLALLQRQKVQRILLQQQTTAAC